MLLVDRGAIVADIAGASVTPVELAAGVPLDAPETLPTMRPSPVPSGLDGAVVGVLVVALEVHGILMIF